MPAIGQEDREALRRPGLAGAEALALVEAARDAGCDRVVVTRAQFEVVDMSLDEMRRAAGMGAKMELCWMRHWRQVPIRETAERVRAVGAEPFVLASDLGQRGAGPAPHGVTVAALECAACRTRATSSAGSAGGSGRPLPTSG